MAASSKYDILNDSIFQEARGMVAQEKIEEAKQELETPEVTKLIQETRDKEETIVRRLLAGTPHENSERTKGRLKYNFLSEIASPYKHEGAKIDFYIEILSLRNELPPEGKLYQIISALNNYNNGRSRSLTNDPHLLAQELKNTEWLGSQEEAIKNLINGVASITDINDNEQLKRLKQLNTVNELVRSTYMYSITAPIFARVKAIDESAFMDVDTYYAHINGKQGLNDEIIKRVPILKSLHQDQQRDLIREIIVTPSISDGIVHKAMQSSARQQVQERYGLNPTSIVYRLADASPGKDPILRFDTLYLPENGRGIDGRFNCVTARGTRELYHTPCDIWVGEAPFDLKRYHDTIASEQNIRVHVSLVTEKDNHRYASKRGDINVDTVIMKKDDKVELSDHTIKTCSDVEERRCQAGGTPYFIHTYDVRNANGATHQEKHVVIREWDDGAQGQGVGEDFAEIAGAIQACQAEVGGNITMHCAEGRNRSTAMAAMVATSYKFQHIATTPAETLAKEFDDNPDSVSLQSSSQDIALRAQYDICKNITTDVLILDYEPEMADRAAESRRKTIEPLDPGHLKEITATVDAMGKNKDLYANVSMNYGGMNDRIRRESIRASRNLATSIVIDILNDKHKKFNGKTNAQELVLSVEQYARSESTSAISEDKNIAIIQKLEETITAIFSQNPTAALDVETYKAFKTYMKEALEQSGFVREGRKIPGRPTKLSFNDKAITLNREAMSRAFSEICDETPKVTIPKTASRDPFLLRVTGTQRSPASSSSHHYSSSPASSSVPVEPQILKTPPPGLGGHQYRGDMPLPSSSSSSSRSGSRAPIMLGSSRYTGPSSGSSSSSDDEKGVSSSAAGTGTISSQAQAFSDADTSHSASSSSSSLSYLEARAKAANIDNTATGREGLRRRAKTGHAERLAQDGTPKPHSGSHSVTEKARRDSSSSEERSK